MSNWTFRTVAPNEILRFNLFGQSIRFDLRRYLLVRLRKTDEFGLPVNGFAILFQIVIETAHFALLQEQHKGYAVKPMPRFDKSSSARTSPLLSIRAFRAISLFHCCAKPSCS